jgi:hypothetical protein
MYSWQTILALRILGELRSRFFVEVGSWRKAMIACQDILRRKPFPALQGGIMHFKTNSEASLFAAGQISPETQGILVPLSPHLQAISTGFEKPDLAQLPLLTSLKLRA